MNIYSEFEAAAGQWADRPALLTASRATSYRELRAGAEGAEAVLENAGLRAGDRVLLMLPNCPEFVACYLGAMRMGATVVSLSYQATESELTRILRDCVPTVIVGTSEVRARLPTTLLAGARAMLVLDPSDGWGALLAGASGAPSPVVARTAQDPAALLYTSGTTGSAKGVTLSHGNIAFDTAAHRRCCALTADDRILLFLPLSHCFGQNAVMNSALAAGACLILREGFVPAEIATTIARECVSVVFAVPAALAALQDVLTPAQAASVRLWFSAAAPLSPELAEQWEARYRTPLAQGYGLTETSPFAAFNPATRGGDRSVGRAIAGVEIRAWRDDGTPAAAGELGELAIRGPNVMLGYWNRPDDTAAAVRQGWFFTGDLGRVGADGVVELAGRAKDVIISGGRKILPAEVEEVLALHPAVQETVVLGIAEATMGEKVLAQVVVRPEAEVSAGELRQFAAQRLATYKLPGAIHFVGAIPRSRTGKILRHVIRSYYSQAAPVAIGPDAREATTEDIATWIDAWIRQTTGASVANPTASFIELGVTSALGVQLAADLAQWLNRPVSATVAWNYPTIPALAAAMGR